METLWSYLSSKRWFSLSTRRLLPICKGKGSSLADVTLSRSGSMSIANPMPWRVKHHGLIWAEEPPCTLITRKMRVVQLQKLPFFLITGKIRHFFSMLHLYCNNLLIKSDSSIKKKQLELKLIHSLSSWGTMIYSRKHRAMYETALLKDFGMILFIRFYIFLNFPFSKMKTGQIHFCIKTYH